MRKVLGWLLITALLLALPASALADIRRGDRGDDVLELQQLLWECGWIFEEPDGVFGKRTEDALKNYQRYAGFEADGVATDAVMLRLKRDWSELFGTLYPGLEDEPSTDYEIPEHCRVAVVQGMLRTEFCPVHLEVHRQADALCYGGAAELAQASQLWEDAVDALYADWIAAASPEEKLNVLAAYGGWKAAAEQQFAALTALYPQDAYPVYEQMLLFFQNQAVTLCGLSYALNAGE